MSLNCRLGPQGYMLMRRARWLDEAYPGLPSVYLPTASLPLDVEAPEYVAAKEDADAFRKSMPFFRAFVLHMVVLFRGTGEGDDGKNDSRADEVLFRRAQVAWVVLYLWPQDHQGIYEGGRRDSSAATWGWDREGKLTQTLSLRRTRSTSRATHGWGKAFGKMKSSILTTVCLPSSLPIPHQQIS